MSIKLFSDIGASVVLIYELLIYNESSHLFKNTIELSIKISN